MSNILTILLTVVLGAGCPLVPRPQSSVPVDEKFSLADDVVITYDAAAASQAEFLQGELLRYLDITSILSLSDGRNASEGIVLCEGPKNWGPEQYAIDMSSEKVVITANAKGGFVYGVTSLIQLARLSQKDKGSVLMDCWKISDKPRYEWRGFMLDEARHFWGMKKVKQLLDWMATYRMNRFHWHLCDEPGWRIEIKKYPRLALVGGVGEHGNPDVPAQFYTQDEIREIVAYAARRNIEVIPEIDMPGHATAAVKAYPEFDGGGSEKRPSYTFNPGKEGTYQFLNDILAEIDALFPSQIVHIGGDEVSHANEQWNTDPHVQSLMKREGLDSLKAVENYFCKRMADSLYRRNNRIAAWDEMAGADLNKEKTIIYFWRQNRTDMLQKAFDNEFSVVFSPRLPMYFDYANDTLQVHGVPWKKFTANNYWKVYDYECTGYDVKYPKNPRILGIQANMWTERVFTEDRLDYMIFPRIAALAETAWTQKENKDLKNFDERLKKQFNLYRKEYIYFCNPFDREDNGEPMR